MGTFDLRDVLADKAYPTTVVKVLMDERIYFELAALADAHAAATSATEQKRIAAQFKAKVEERDANQYAVHLRGTSPRAREDIQSLALATFPIKRDMWGREDDLQAVRRGQLLAQLYFAAHITKIVAPNGDEQEFTEENRNDVAQAFLDAAPEHSIKMVDTAITALRGEAEAQKYAQQDADFLSRTSASPDKAPTSAR